ncbi:uncharacterized protein [Oryctolagus cuniculus]|uniref:uncharacterized protein n=1 Tax=Oryctolagus cuniculus TaxID=9986 RepID=UPI0038791A34
MHGKADIFLDGTTLAIPLYVTRGAVPRGTPPHRLCSGLTHSFPSQHLVTEDTLCRAPCRELGRKGDWGPGLPPGRVRRSAASPGPRDRRALRAGGPANCQAQGLPQGDSNTARRVLRLKSCAFVEAKALEKGSELVPATEEGGSRLPQAACVLSLASQRSGQSGLPEGGQQAEGRSFESHLTGSRAGNQSPEIPLERKHRRLRRSPGSCFLWPFTT